MPGEGQDKPESEPYGTLSEQGLAESDKGSGNR